MKWNPMSLDELSHLLENRTDWFLDGGHALDVFLRSKTREHGDTDIGVFSTNTKQLLAYLKQQGLTILIANRDLINYEEENFNSTDYNYWVADQTGYRLQVLVYHQEHGRVLFRRNKKISWPTESFLLNVDHWRITNPLVSYAFKVTNLDPFQKDMHDIDRLFSAVSKNVS